MPIRASNLAKIINMIPTGASGITTNVSGFDNILSETDANVQLALETLNNYVPLNNSVEVASTPVQNVTIGTDMVVVDASSTPVTINLYSASNNTGKEVAVRKKDTGTNPITVVPTGSEKINGKDSISLTYENEIVTLKSDGTNWYVLTSQAYDSYSRVLAGTTAPTDTEILWFDTNE